MTLVVTLYVREGIVMASDSRMSVTVLSAGAELIPGVVTVSERPRIQTDSVFKVYSVGERIGISAFGAADVAGVPISGFMESFARRHQKDTGTVEDTAKDLVREFRDQLKVFPTGFHIAGYDSRGGFDHQVVYRLPLHSSKLEMVNSSEAAYGAVWDGEDSVMTRLYKNVQLVDPDDAAEPITHYEVDFKWFTLQDAIDFALYAVQVTSETMRFLPRNNTVGGPVDVLVIRPDGPQWLQRKKIAVQS